jgi:NodT family efflux transporter outer membrane factor (OMF) lipoprotein
MKKYLLLSTCLILSGCFAGKLEGLSFTQPESWTAKDAQTVPLAEAESLRGWWKKFNDPALDTLVGHSLQNSPDRLIAAAKIAEARGLKRTSTSYLFPQIGASGSTGREDTGVSGTSPDSFYDARFDASFEIDVFGKNRKNRSAANASLAAAQARYHDVSLTLIAEVVRTYIDFRAAQQQTDIADKNLRSQEKTLKLISDLNRLGEVPRLDVERAESLVNTTRASLPEFIRQAENARLRLSVLTGAMPEDVMPILSQNANIPNGDLKPLLMAPAQIIALRPDIQAAAADLAANTSLAEATTAEIFPTFSLSGFYGIADSALVNSATPWSIALNTAVSLLDFGRIEGRIDAARAREKQAYEQYRKTVLAAVSEVETALSDYAHINEQHASLRKAYMSAEKSLEFSQTLYKEGEVSFLDVLDAQRNTNAAESAMVSAMAAQAESLTRLFKSLGVY